MLRNAPQVKVFCLISISKIYKYFAYKATRTILYKYKQAQKPLSELSILISHSHILFMHAARLVPFATTLDLGNIN